MKPGTVKRTSRKSRRNQLSADSSQFSVRVGQRLNLLQSLHVVNPGNLAHAVDDVFQVLEVCNIENDIDVGLCVRAAHLNVADVGFGVADHGRYLFQHAESIVAKDGKLHGIRARRSLIVGPFHIDAALRLIQEVHDVRAIEGVDGYAFAAGYVTDHALAADGVATAGAVHEQITMAFYADGVVAAVSAENPPNHAGDAAGFISFTVGGGRGGSRRQASQHLPRGVLAVSDSGHQVVDLAQTIVRGDLQQYVVLDLFQRNAVFARFFFDQLAPDFDGALTLMNVEPVFDLVAGAR